MKRLVTIQRVLSTVYGNMIVQLCLPRVCSARDDPAGTRVVRGPGSAVFTTRPRAESVAIRGYGTPGAATATPSRSPSSIFASNDTRALHIRDRRASQGLLGHVAPCGGALRVHGKARQPATYCSQQRRPGRVPRSFRGVSSLPVYRTFVSGCEGPGHRGIA